MRATRLRLSPSLHSVHAPSWAPPPPQTPTVCRHPPLPLYLGRGVQKKRSRRPLAPCIVRRNSIGASAPLSTCFRKGKPPRNALLRSTGACGARTPSALLGRRPSSLYSETVNGHAAIMHASSLQLQSALTHHAFTGCVRPMRFRGRVSWVRWPQTEPYANHSKPC